MYVVIEFSDILTLEAYRVRVFSDKIEAEDLFIETIREYVEDSTLEYETFEPLDDLLNKYVKRGKFEIGGVGVLLLSETD